MLVEQYMMPRMMINSRIMQGCEENNPFFHTHRSKQMGRMPMVELHPSHMRGFACMERSFRKIARVTMASMAAYRSCRQLNV